jgi:hypothetical protein
LRKCCGGTVISGGTSNNFEGRDDSMLRGWVSFVSS